MPILIDVLTAPRFQADRFAKAKDDLIQEMKKRNDDSANIESREWDRLIYGDGYWINQLPTKASVDAITDADCKSFVTSLVKAGNVVVAVAGDFEEPALKDLLDRTLGALPKETAQVPPVPQPDHVQEPGVYLVDKPDVNQGRVSVGQLGFRLGTPDEASLLVMNDILGGGGFTSRITKSVRSDKGLAYSAGSYMTFPVTYPGFFRALFQSKSRTCAGALGITMRLIRGMGEQEVSASELETAKSSFLLTFPRRFESAEKTATLFAGDELLGRPHSYWTSYRQRIAAVTADDVLRVAKDNLRPDRMAILVVGNSEEILKGHPDFPDKLGDFGPIHKVPLRDPLTLAPLTEEGK
jgi:zinc protease